MENSPSIKSIAYSYGGGLALYSIVMLIIIYIANIQPDGSMNYVISGLNIIVSIAVFALALSAFKKNNNGFISLSQALKTGLAVAAIAGIIAAIYTFFHYSYVYPEYLDIIKDQQRTGMIESGQMSDEQIEQSIEMMSFSTSPFFLSTVTLILNLFFGFLISLIVGLVIKKKNPALER
jgi:hypothetical protein